MRGIAILCVAGILSAQSTPEATSKAHSSDDPLLAAMKDELQRSRTLQISGLDKPYFIEYTVEDLYSYGTSAVLGGIVVRNSNHNRIPRTRIRVGDYSFDNANYLYSDMGSGSTELPIDDNYAVLRRSFWLSTDRAFKRGVEAITRKRAALKNLTQPEALADLWKAPTVQKIRPNERQNVSLDAWTSRVRDFSNVFSAYPEVLTSLVTFDASDSTFYLTNSEGSTLRIPEFISTLQVRATGQSSDGMTVRDGAVIPVLHEKSFPSNTEIKKAVEQVAQRVKALAAAPMGENYSGPVLFEGMAGAQLIAELLAPDLALARRPIGEPGRPAPFQPSEFEGRMGSRVLPEFLDVVDDPTVKSWKGTPLLGTYDFDYEAVVPAPVTVVDKGKLKTLLLTRQPVRGFESSNGRARVPGSYGANAGAVSNLFVRASETVKKEELRARLLKMLQDRGKPYALIVRKMDFPTIAPSDELRRLFTASAQHGAHPVSTPLQVFRVYPDGREELVRGLRFRGLSVRTLRDIVAVSEDTFVFSYLNTLAPMSMPGSTYVSPTSVIAPSLLLEDIEVERPQDEMPNLPVVPPPPLTAAVNR